MQLKRTDIYYHQGSQQKDDHRASAPWEHTCVFLYRREGTSTFLNNATLNATSTTTPSLSLPPKAPGSSGKKKEAKIGDEVPSGTHPDRIYHLGVKAINQVCYFKINWNIRLPPLIDRVALLFQFNIDTERGESPNGYQGGGSVIWKAFRDYNLVLILIYPERTV